MAAFRFKDIVKAASDLLFPLECVSCGAPGGHCCYGCLARVPFSPPPDASEIPGLDGLFAAAPYGHPLVKRIVKDLKFFRIRAAEASMAALARRWVVKHGAVLPSGALIVPVPLHPRRLRERGFDQAALVASAFAAASGSPMEASALRRFLAAPPRSKDKDKKAGVLRAFSVAEPGLVAGRIILLVDDVVTTGATMAGCAEALKGAGATMVIGLALADATKKPPEEGGGKAEAMRPWRMG